MNHQAFMSLLEEKRDDIIRTIRTVVIESFMPDFYGIYEIFLDEENGQIGFLEVECDRTFSKEDSPLHYLYEIPSHAIKKGDFIAWLTEEGFRVSNKQNEKNLRQKYKKQYQKFLNDICIDAMIEIAEAENTFQIIYDLYKKNKKIVPEDILDLF